MPQNKRPYVSKWFDGTLGNGEHVRRKEGSKGGTVKLDQRGSVVLSEDECRRHLGDVAASSGIGRLAVNGSRSPHVIPVNFTLVDGGILIRLGTGWSAFHLDGAAVTFEADEADPHRRSGWSVVVEGIARLLPDDETARLGAKLPSPMVTEPGVRVYEIVPFKVSGRAVEPAFRGGRVEADIGPLESAGSGSSQHSGGPALT
jgi:hypothetical protein